MTVAMGLGYAAWNVSILHDNVTLLAAASYFIPVISSLFAALLPGQTLSHNFRAGAIMVCAGSLLCWYTSRSPA